MVTHTHNHIKFNSLTLLKVEEMYHGVGCRIVVPPLLEPCMTRLIDDDGRDDAQLSLEEFCARYAPLVADEQTQVNSKTQ